MKKVLTAIIILVILQPGFAGTKKPEKGADSKKFFGLTIGKGDKLGNIFSRTISYKGDAFQELVFRAAGTGIYTVIDNNPQKPVFDGVFRYDGRPETKYRIEMSDTGKTVTYDGKASVNTDGSGLLFNALIWGNPPAKIKTGDHWQTSISQAWELGGAGAQTITVMSIDENNHTATLKREGGSEGFYDNDARQISITREGKQIKMNVAPGRSHWIGYTTFKNGLVISDELLVTRPVSLTAEGIKLDAFQREYILLNAMPVS